MDSPPMAEPDGNENHVPKRALGRLVPPTLQKGSGLAFGPLSFSLAKTALAGKAQIGFLAGRNARAAGKGCS
jgi:hypothetical protein